MNDLFDFTKGAAAALLLEKRGLSLDGISEKKILIDGTDLETKNIPLNAAGFFVFSEQDSDSFLFMYKKKYYGLWNGEKRFPVYHIFDCEAVKKFDGYVFSNIMPAEVIEKRSNHISTKDLRLCKNCRKMALEKNFSFDFESSWYETLLTLVSQEKNPIYRSDGYLTSWDQASHAYKTSKEYVCEACQLNLSDPASKIWLHTHHRDGCKKNNHRDNFQALCQLCHTWEHRNSLQVEKMKGATSRFVNLFKDKLSTEKVRWFQQLMGDI